MNKVLKRRFLQLAAILLSVLLMLSVLTALNGVKLFARADDSTSSQIFQDTPVSIDNSQFATSSGNYPKKPDNWTGAVASGESEGGVVVGGVIELDTYASNENEYKLKSDYGVKAADIDSPFGKADNAYKDTNRNVLMINVRPDNLNGLAYGYTSSGITMSANKFYMVQAWVRTGNFAQDHAGASIRLNGLDDNVAFANINTVKGLSALNSTNDYGWDQYTFYIAAPSMGTKTVTISLGIGDRYVDADGNVLSYNPTVGFALFDNITAYEIAPSTFYNTKKNAVGENTIVKDYSELKDYYNNDSDLNLHTDENWNFAQPQFSDWTGYIDGDNTSGNDFAYAVIDGNNISDVSMENFKIAERPGSSLGDFTLDNKIFMISSYRYGQFNSIAYFRESKDILIERYKYYRIAAWVKTESINGSGATLQIHATRNPGNEKQDLATKITGATGDSTNTARSGWKQHSFFIKGSSIEDMTVNLRIGLGADGSESQGIVFFDNVTVTELTPQQYTDNSAEGTIVDVDTDKGPDGSTEYRTFTDTGITNSNFLLAGTYKDYELPIIPSGWTKYTVDTVETNNYSNNKAGVNYDNVVSGLIPTDEAYFNKFLNSFGNDKGVYNPYPTKEGSVLMLYSQNKTAYCYRSTAFAITANTAGKVVVTLNADNMDSSDYGASLVLKNGNNVISTIEGIKNTNGFVEYTFLIEGGAADSGEITLEIWLGLNDRNSNLSKLSSGFVYVDSATYAVLPEGKTYSDEVKNLNDRMAAYSLTSENLTAFDNYDTNYVRYPYNWSMSVTGTENSNVIYGIFNPKNGIQTPVPSTFKNAEGAVNDNVLMLYNLVPAASKLTLNTTYTLKANTYYKLEAKIKVDIKAQDNKNAVGAALSIKDTQFKFKNILSTTYVSDEIVDAEVFRTYTFYVNPGNTETPINFELSLGDNSSPSKYCSGRVYLNEITVSEITNSLFENSTTDEMLENNPYTLKAMLTDKSDSGDSGETGNPDWQVQWWLIPSILFAVAILMAVIGVAVRRVMERRGTKVTYEKTVSYDRNATLNQDFNAKTTDENEKLTNVETIIAVNDKSYDSFNDDAVRPLEESAKKTLTTSVKSDSTFDEFNDDVTVETMNDGTEIETNEHKDDNGVEPKTMNTINDEFDD